MLVLHLRPLGQSNKFSPGSSCGGFGRRFFINLEYVMASIIYATKTISLIDSMIEADQGATFRTILRDRIPEAGDAYEGRNDDFRSHLGVSSSGRECSRALYYNWRWVKAAKFSGRTLRLFNRGHLEEPRFVAMLQMIGCTVWQLDQYGKQFRVSYFGGHFGSALDSVIDGCPDLPGVNMLSEYKTHNDKSFKGLIKEGVRFSKPEHFVQQQIYCSSYNLPWSLYLAVNKDTDELYGEMVKTESEIANKYIERAHRIIFAVKAPEKISQSPGFYKCKYCDYNNICHLDEPVAVNCRTCQYSIPLDNGKWGCYNHNVEIDKARQLIGCQTWKIKDEFAK